MILHSCQKFHLKTTAHMTMSSTDSRMCPRRWREALATLDRMRSTGIPPDVYSFNSAISACGRGGMCQRALDLLAEMEYEGSGVRSDLISYNGAINAVAKAGR